MIGRYHAEATRSAADANLVAVADLDMAKAKQIGEDLGVAKVYRSGAALIRDQLFELRAVK